MTERLERARIAYAKAVEDHRIAAHGERARTQKRLAAANKEVLAAELEAERIAKTEAA